MSLIDLGSPARLEFSHGGDYSPRGDSRPIVDIEFAAVTQFGLCLGSLVTGVVVDSGARTTVLSFEDSFTLGLNIAARRYPKDLIGGIVPGRGMRVAYALIKAQLCGRWYDIPACFPLGATSPPIRKVLGREGVFDRLRIAFVHEQRLVYASA